MEQYFRKWLRSLPGNFWTHTRTFLFSQSASVGACRAQGCLGITQGSFFLSEEAPWTVFQDCLSDYLWGAVPWLVSDPCHSFFCPFNDAAWLTLIYPQMSAKQGLASSIALPWGPFHTLMPKRVQYLQELVPAPWNRRKRITAAFHHLHSQEAVGRHWNWVSKPDMLMWNADIPLMS